MGYAIKEYKRSKNIKQAASVFTVMTVYNAIAVTAEVYLKARGMR